MIQGKIYYFTRAFAYEILILTSLVKVIEA